MSWLFGSKKKKQQTVSQKLEETMMQAASPNGPTASFFTMQPNENTISDLEAAETRSDNGLSERDKKFLNLMEVLNNPANKADLLTSLNHFFSSNFAALGNAMHTRKLQQSVSKGITMDSFASYNSKISRIASMIRKNQEQDKKDREQYENFFQRSRPVSPRKPARARRSRLLLLRQRALRPRDRRQPLQQILHRGHQRRTRNQNRPGRRRALLRHQSALQ